MDDEQQQRFADAVERKKAEADAASRAPHEEHAHGSEMPEKAQRTPGDSNREGVRPAGQKGGGSSKHWST